MTSQPVSRRNPARQPGESNQDCIARLCGELRAAEMDRERLRSENERLREELVQLRSVRDRARSIVNGEFGWDGTPGQGVARFILVAETSS